MTKIYVPRVSKKYNVFQKKTLNCIVFKKISPNTKQKQNNEKKDIYQKHNHRFGGHENVANPRLWRKCFI